jgi:predicted CXXCH cytochrome family protein
MKLIFSVLTIGFIIIAIFFNSTFGKPNPASGLENYIGSEKCISCHNSLHPEIVKEWQTSPHHLVAKLGYGNFLDKLNPSLKKEDVFMVIGRTDSNYAFITRDYRVYRPEDKKQDASLTCFGCHTTGYFVSKKQFVEADVGCEACHGPGKKHVDSNGSPNTIVNLAKLSPERKRMICGQCHSKGNDISGKYRFPVMKGGRPFQPGDDLNSGFIDWKPIVKTIGGEYSTLIQAPKPYSDQLCTDCHAPHGKQGNHRMLIDPTSAICLKCHGDRTTGIAYVEPERHWGADRSTCWTCHEYAHLH